jgi:hypothetical protein
MNEQLQSIISVMMGSSEEDGPISFLDCSDNFKRPSQDNIGVAETLNTAFLYALSGSKRSGDAKNFLVRMSGVSGWQEVACFYLNGIELVHRELERACQHQPQFADHLNALSDWVSRRDNLKDHRNTAEKFWKVFFPEGEGIQGHEKSRIKALRAKRHVTITDLNPHPLTDPARQVLFTSNVLLTAPSSSKSIDALTPSEAIKAKLEQIKHEPQLYWYDHPIPMGVEPENNEVLYGLKGLEKTFEFEKDRGNIPDENTRLTCVLSVSVTHKGLHDIAKAYLKEELLSAGGRKHLDVSLFTEADTDRIIEEILTVAAKHYLGQVNAKECLNVFGVDGEYGRHYSFLKAIAAFMGVFVNPELRATFKIDLDQVFPQKELVNESGASAFEHLRTPLWGAQGRSRDGQSLDMGMIAGALVNDRDIRKSLFTPDVRFADFELSQDEYFFFSPLPQALSTEAEMMTRYGSKEHDGKSACIHRIHVTGGTNGITLDSLRRYRPFTPSFIGRAEDQAYILSTLTRPETKLAYLHEAGLFMRHDKKSFAEEAMQSASISKLIGDYVRIILFSAYAGALTDDVSRLKETIDPFTGCFVSAIPTTDVYLRFGFKAASFFKEGKGEEGLEFIKNGAGRITGALNFVEGENSMLKKTYEKEYIGWNLYYDILSAVEDALNKGDEFALGLKRRAESILDDCTICF